MRAALIVAAALAVANCKDDGGSAGESGPAAASDSPASIDRREPRPSAVPAPASTQPASGELTAEEKATLEKVMVVREQMAEIADKHQSHCDKASKELEAIVSRNRELLAASAEMERDPARRRLIGETYGARMLASSSKLMALIENCDQHEGLARLFESLD